MRGTWGAVVVLAATALTGAGACGGSSTAGFGGSGGSSGAAGNDASTVCVPGQSSACTGPQACKGFQVCRSDGSGYAPCDCSAADAGGVGGTDGGAGTGGTGGAAGFAGSGGSSAIPKTCTEAAGLHGSYGCDFWPTVTENLVWSTFDFAVLVDNPGKSAAVIAVTKGGTAVTNATVAPGQAEAVYLPWVPELKGPDADTCGTAGASQPSVRVSQGAYHLTSTVPVGVYQFNAYEYQGQGGPPGKDWSACAGSQVCSTSGAAIGCFAFSNDASLLLPSTSLGTSYRVTGDHGWSTANIGPYAVITATRNGTQVTVKLSSSANVVAGGGVTATSAGGSVQLSMDAGDVVSLASSPTADSSGTLVSADKPVQVIAGMSCTEIPDGTSACDHIEETVLPAAALGRDYVVAVPTAPGGTPVGHVVRLYGHVDKTTLIYPAGTVPSGAPTTLSAGQVVDLGNVTQDFEVKGNHPFGVTSILLGGGLLDPVGPSGSQEGDPSRTNVIPIEQYRSLYAFAIAEGYDSTYVDVVAPIGTTLTLDGSAVTVTGTPIGGSTSYATWRIKVAPLPSKAHVLVGDAPFSAQVTGYGKYTSYQYPAGLNAKPLP